MALVRCEKHPPKGRSTEYVRAVEPTGYPETAVVCGRTHCEEPGLIWLRHGDEDESYDSGEKVFLLNNNMATKLKAK